MRDLISPASMRACEAKYFAESGVKSIDVMERAAQALADAIAAELPTGAVIHFACGTGGNGGDGTACARLLAGRYRCTIVQPSEPKSGDAIENLRRAKDMGIMIAHTCVGLPCPDAWVDALFGTGLSRPVDGEAAKLIARINADHDHGARVYAADIPSGLNGATGQAYEPCICADRTVTFQYLKSGLVLADGLDCCGSITVADVGFPEESFLPYCEAKLMERADIARLLGVRPRNIHKGTCGHLLIVAGSFGMAGAAAMCAQAALRSGAGLVSIACVKSIVPMLQVLAPQAMCIPLEEADGAISRDALPALASALRGKDAAVVGCGLSRRAHPDVVQLVLDSGIPAVVDADALNILSENPAMMRRLKKQHVITPHPGEAARLMEAWELFGRLCAEQPEVNEEEISRAVASARANCMLSADSRPAPLGADPIGVANRLSALGATALYKGAACAVADGESNFVSASGCCGMARGGSGDILSGIMGALLAERSGRTSALTAALASEIHGLAGELAQQKYGSRSMNAADIIEFLPEVFGP